MPRIRKVEITDECTHPNLPLSQTTSLYDATTNTTDANVEHPINTDNLSSHIYSRQSTNTIYNNDSCTTDVYTVDNTLNNSDTCTHCKKDFISKDGILDCIGCDVCGSWLHFKCGGLTKTQFNTLVSLGDAVRWLCFSCRTAVLVTGNSISPCNKPIPSIAENNLTVLTNGLAKTMKAVEELSVKFDKLLSKPKDVHVLSETPKPTYSSVVKKIVHGELTKVSPSNTNSVTSKNTNHNMVAPTKNDCVVVLSRATDHEKCNSPNVLHSELCKLFPRIRLLHSSKKPSGLIFMTFASSDDAKRALDNWLPSYFGTNTSVNMYQPSSSNAVILKNVPISFSEA